MFGYVHASSGGSDKCPVGTLSVCPVREQTCLCGLLHALPKVCANRVFTVLVGEDHDDVCAYYRCYSKTKPALLIWHLHAPAHLRVSGR